MVRLETKVDTILNNHLPHIQAAIDDVEKRVINFEHIYKQRMWWFLSLFVTNLIAIIFLLLHERT